MGIKNIEVKNRMLRKMDSNINNEKSLKPLSLNDLRQMGGGIEQSLSQNNKSFVILRHIHVILRL